jgi:hypothetical protein
MNFAFFLLLNAALLIRPEEVFPSLAGLRLYFIAAGLCILTSVGRLTELFTPASLRENPIGVCVLIFYFSTILTLVLQGQIDEAVFGFGADFGKVILFYFLLLAAVDSESRFRAYVVALVTLISILIVIALAQHHGTINIEGVKLCLERQFNTETGEESYLQRLVSTGIFNDPNDLCLILGLGILSCLYLATTEVGIMRVLWLIPIPLFAYAIIETHSRGGLLGIMAGLSAYLYSRFGGAKSLPLAIGGAFLLLIAIGGRSAKIEGTGTAHHRMMLWSNGLTELINHPHMLLTGLGIGWYVGDEGYVAHNSFVQAYVEQGLLGGGAFLAAFLFLAWMIYQIGQSIPSTTWTLQSRHYAFAVLIGYAAGNYSLTRNYAVPTYLVLGLASVVVSLSTSSLPEKYRVSSTWFVRLFIASILGFVGIRVATILLVKVSS